MPEAGEIAQQLKTLVGLPEDQGSNPTTRWLLIRGSQGTQTYYEQIYMQAKHPHTYNKKQTFLKKKILNYNIKFIWAVLFS